MKQNLTILFLILTISISMAQEQTAKYPANQADEEKDLSAMLDAYLNQKDILPRTSSLREYVEVKSESYPGLEFNLLTPAEMATGYRPSKKSTFVETDSLLDRIYDYTLTGTARPHKSGRLFEVKVPD